MPHLVEPLRPGVILRLVRGAERDVMHAAGALPRRRQILLLEHVQFGGGTALAHREHVNLRAVRGIVAHAAHVHDLGQHERGRATTRAR